MHFVHFSPRNRTHLDLGVFALNLKLLKFLDSPTQLVQGLKPKSFHDDLGTKSTQPLPEFDQIHLGQTLVLGFKVFCLNSKIFDLLT